MAKRNVLLVDADPRSLRVLEVTLRQAGHNLTIARDGAQGWERLLELVPDLLIADTRLPKLDGYELVKRMKDLPDGALVPVLFLTQQRSVEDKIRGLELGVEDYLSKPIFVRELLGRVETMFARSAQRALALGRASGSLAQSSGHLRDLSVVDLLQTFEGARKSGILRVALAARDAVSDVPDMSGRVYFRAGRAVDAELGRLRGEEAIYRMLVWRDGTFEVELGDVSRADLIGQPTQAILMEGLRRADEWHRLCEQVPSLDTIFELDHQELEGRLRRVPDELSGVLSLFDGKRSLLQIIDESPFEDLSTLSTVSKLYFEGFLRSAALRNAPSAEVRAVPPAPPPAVTAATTGASTTSPGSEPRWVSAESYESLPALPSSPASDPKAPALLSSPFLPASSAPSLPAADDVLSHVEREEPSAALAEPSLDNGAAPRTEASVPPGAAHAEADPFSERPAPLSSVTAAAEDASGDADDETQFSGVGARARAAASGDADADEPDVPDAGDQASKPPPPIVSGRPLVIWGTLILLGASFAVIGARRCVRGEHDNAAELRLTATAPPSARSSYVPPPVALPPPPDSHTDPLPSPSPASLLSSGPRTLPPPARHVYDAPVVVPQRGGANGAGGAGGALPHAAEPTSTAVSPTGTAASPPASLPPQPSTLPSGPAPEGANGDATKETAAAQRALEQANPGRAAELARVGTGKNPKDAETWLTLGAAYEAVGQKARARAAYQSCVSRAEGPRVEECRALLSRPY